VGAGHVKVAILKLEGKQIRRATNLQSARFNRYNTICCMADVALCISTQAVAKICLASCIVFSEWEPRATGKRSESTCDGEESNMNSKRRRMSDYAWILVLIGWFVLMKFVLPRFGVST
jgi:hypothetical protein